MGSTIITPSCQVFFFFCEFFVYMAVKCFTPPPVAGAAARGSEGVGPVFTNEEEKDEGVRGTNRLVGGLKPLFVALGKEEEAEEEEEAEAEEEEGGQGMFSLSSAAAAALVVLSVAGMSSS
jgi:hypothetical protein